jgi:thiamine-monophosphate kinase
VGETIADIGEFGLIDRIRELVPPGVEGAIGVGDDAAVLDIDGRLVASVDSLIEGRHFRPDWVSAQDIGHRAAAASLADLTAMGATPQALLVALGLPPTTEVDWVADMITGMVAEAEQVGAHVVGGDLSRADAVMISVTALGQARTVVTRSGARAGDVVAIAGRQGWAAAGLTVLSRGFRSPRALVGAYQRPRPPYESGPEAVAAGATAMIDVSDGLLADVRHIAMSSGVLIDLDSDLVPVADQLVETSSAFNTDPLTWVLAGGDDHALVATFPAGADLPQMFTVIGHVVPPSSNGPGVSVDGRFWNGQGGHDHFRA